MLVFKIIVHVQIMFPKLTYTYMYNVYLKYIVPLFEELNYLKQMKNTLNMK